MGKESICAFGILNIGFQFWTIKHDLMGNSCTRCLYRILLDSTAKP